MKKIIWIPGSQKAGTKLALHWWPKPPDSLKLQKGYVWLVHGLGEHASRYTEMALFLNQFGFDVLCLDLPGHGLSRSEGGLPELVDLDFMLNELEAAHTEWSERGPSEAQSLHSKPWFLVAHSMGSILSLKWIIRGKKKDGKVSFANKAFLSAPPIELRLAVPEWKRQLAKSLANVAPYFELNNEIALNDLSYDAANRGAFDSDKLTHSMASPTLFLSIQQSALDVKAKNQDIEIPLALAVGQDDPIVDPKGLRTYYDSLRTHKSFFEFPKMKHEIFNETERSYVYRAMLSWIL